MPDAITTAEVIAYKNAVELLMQQKDSRLAGKVGVDTYVGKQGAVVEQFGSATAQLRTSRHADTPLLDLSQARRWVHPKDYEWASLIDNVDKLRLNIQPEGAYTQAAAASHMRVRDEVIYDAMGAAAVTGETGTGSESFDTTNYQVGVDVGGTASNINVEKLRDALKKLMLANKGELMEPAFVAFSAYEHDALLGQLQIVNRDYNGGAAVLEAGRIRRFAGFDFTVLDDGLMTITSGNREVFAWVKSGMHLGVWQDLMTKIDQRPDKGYSWQVYTCQTIGSTRTQQGKVVKILCDDLI